MTHLHLAGRREKRADPLVALRVIGDRRRGLVGAEQFPNTYRGAVEGQGVAVEIAAADERALVAYVGQDPAGYLAPTDADEYRPVVDRANQMGFRVVVSGRFERVAASRLSLALLMPVAEDLANWLGDPDAAMLG